MTKKDLFKIILKLFGLYSLIELCIKIPTVCYAIYLDSDSEFIWLSLTIPMASFIVVLILLFKPERFINLFKLDQGYDSSEVPINIFGGKGLASIALIIIAIYLIVSNLGGFISELLFSFKASVSRNEIENLTKNYQPNPVNYQLMISSGISLLVGYLLLTNHSRLALWIEKTNSANMNF